MRRVLAVDGGQSAIRVRFSEAGHSAAVEGVSQLEGDTIVSVVGAIVKGWRRSGSPAVERAVLGLTTAPVEESSRRHLCEQVARSIDAAQVWLSGDTVTGHAGALSLAWGISLIVGTGVSCLAMPREGRPRVHGGDGYLIGDEGGAFWIGSEGIRAVLKAADGRGPSTALVAPAERHFEGLGHLGDRLHRSERPVNTIAGFAPHVLEAAGSQDAVASGIADRAADELAALVGAAARRMSPDDRPLPVALGGRLVDSEPLRDRLEQSIARCVPDAAIRSADGSPLQGALLLGQAADPGRYRDFVYVWEAGK